jgi:hypothetical protein
LNSWKLLRPSRLRGEGDFFSREIHNRWEKRLTEFGFWT